MSTKSLVEEIVDYMVEEGPACTFCGDWPFEVPALADQFEVYPDWFFDHNDELLEELNCRDAVEDVDVTYDYNNFPTIYTVKFDKKYWDWRD